MSVEANYILRGIAVGIGATLVMDLWNLFLKRTLGIPSLSYCLLGRWLRHMPGGTFRHASITGAPQKPYECTVGWIAHYTIGVVFALVFVVVASRDWLARPTLLPALLYGIGTVVLPFCIMQPSIGLGVAASRTPNPTRARLKSLMTHTVFGVGLYVCALGVSYVLRVAHHAPSGKKSRPPSRTKGELGMKSNRMGTIAIVTALISTLGGRVVSAQDKYTLKVPGGLAFSEFRGYEAWQVVSVSQDGPLFAAILANPVMIEAYRAGVPGNGKPFPDGSKMAKIHWNPKKLETFPAATVPGTQHDVDFMVKDSKRFADSGGWGWAAFNYNAASRTFTPGTTADQPPQGNDAKCGLGCHTIVKTRDYVFTDYGSR